MLGRRIPLYGINTSVYAVMSMNAEELLMQTIGGDAHQYSVFAIGISPYLLSTFFVNIIMACKNSDSKAKTSPSKINKISLALTITLTVVQALIHVKELKFEPVGNANIFLFVKIVAILEMVTGVMIIVWLVDRNKRYGIGGQTVLIYINILEGILSTVSGHGSQSLAVPMFVSVVIMEIVVIMENTEKRIPVQRVSIHNIYADKNYLAIKLNPIGMIPLMFSTAFFMLPQMILFLLAFLFPNHSEIMWLQENITLTRPMGIVVYIGCLYLLTISFSLIFISPGDITEQFLKSGDSILDLQAGADTKRYLTGTICRMGFFSATIMSICVGIPLFLQWQGNIDGNLAMLPTSSMMMTGIWCNLYREYVTIQNYDAYQSLL